MGKPSRATHLAGSIEVQTLLRVMASFGETGVRTAIALIHNSYDFKDAARVLKVKPDVLRQWVHRIQERVKGVRKNGTPWRRWRNRALPLQNPLHPERPRRRA